MSTLSSFFSSFMPTVHADAPAEEAPEEEQKEEATPEEPEEEGGEAEEEEDFHAAVGEAVEAMHNKIPPEDLTTGILKSITGPFLLIRI